MRKSSKLLACFLLLITALSPIAKVSAETKNYTYTYDPWWVNTASPDAYTVETILIGSTLGIGEFRDPQGLFVRDDMIFIVDSGNNRIVEVNKSLQLVREIYSIQMNGEESTFNYPTDIFVAPNKDLYIFDSANFRVLHVDYNLNFIKSYTKPEKEVTLSADQNFIPLKGVVDTAGRMYLMAKNINKGFMEFSADGEFESYVGANKVKATFVDVLKKRIMTKEQRSRMELNVPTEYSNVAIDKDNFLYATTTTFTEGELKSNPKNVNPIRRINSLGEDILIKIGMVPVIGDVYWGNGGDVRGPSRFSDITAMDNDSYFALDRNRGRIFAYDFQGNLLYAFGGIGNKKGYFQYPVAIDHADTDLFVLDAKAASVTRFTLTEYGRLINDGLRLYKEGRYEESAEYWTQVIKLNGNFDLAYIGIGRALLRQGKYEESMHYFKPKYDYDNYSKAFVQYRKLWVEANIGYLFGGFALLFILPKIVKVTRKLIKGGAQK